MKLFCSPFSPFARKVMACAVARGIDGQITLVATTGEHPDLVAVNPLGKLPCLVTEDGTALYDSRVICEFLDSVGEVFPMFPAHGARFRALRFQALADGIADAAVLRRGEQARPAEAAREDVMKVQRAKITRALAVLEADVLAAHVDIGTIAVACALGYLDLRYADEPWRDGHPKLAAWHEAMAQHPCMTATEPG